MSKNFWPVEAPSRLEVPPRRRPTRFANCSRLSPDGPWIYQAGALPEVERLGLPDARVGEGEAAKARALQAEECDSNSGKKWVQAQ